MENGCLLAPWLPLVAATVDEVQAHAIGNNRFKLPGHPANAGAAVRTFNLA